MSNKENKELHKIININEDACEFYETAQKKAEDPQLQTTFSNLERLHKDVVINLQARIRANGGDPEAKETLTGQMQQVWTKMIAAISNDVDETLVRNLEEAEDRCLHSLQDAIKSDGIQPDTRLALQNELQSLRKSHDYMKALKEAMKAA